MLANAAEAARVQHHCRLPAAAVSGQCNSSQARSVHHSSYTECPSCTMLKAKILMSCISLWSQGGASIRALPPHSSQSMGNIHSCLGPAGARPCGCAGCTEMAGGSSPVRGVGRVPTAMMWLPRISALRRGQRFPAVSQHPACDPAGCRRRGTAAGGAQLSAASRHRLLGAVGQEWREVERGRRATARL